MSKIVLPFLLLIFLATIGCNDDYYQSRNKLEVYVTQNGDIPDTYELKIYRGDKLVKTDEFDRQHSWCAFATRSNDTSLT